MNPQNAINFNVIGEAFEIVKKRWQPFAIAALIFVGAILVVEIVMYILVFAVSAIGGRSGVGVILAFPIMLICYVVIALVSCVMHGGLTMLALKAIKGEPYEATDVLALKSQPFPFLIAGLLIGVAVMVGSIACGVGAYVASGLTMFTYLFMLDKKLAPMDAIKASFETLKSQWLMAACFMFVIALVGGLGAIACGIGLLFTLPVMFVAQALCYRDLVLKADGADFSTAPIVTVPESVTPSESDAAAAELSSPVAAPVEPEPPAEPETPVEPGEPEPPKD